MEWIRLSLLELGSIERLCEVLDRDLFSFAACRWISQTCGP